MAESASARELLEKPKKRKFTGRQRKLDKIRKLSQHSVGEDCRCARRQCFVITSEDERAALVKRLNEMETKDEQDSYLSSFVSFKNVSRRRPRAESHVSAPNEYSYDYHVYVKRNEQCVKVQVCAKAFISIFGITNRRLITIKTALTTTGAPPKDKRGKHGNRPHKLKEEDLDMIKQHIGSFCSRMSHYSCDRRCKIYLSEDLSIKKMFTIFQQVNPVSSVTYETYRKIFNEHFNISFGYPQSDTCSTCNENLAKLKCKDAKLNNDSSEDDGLLSRRLDSSSQHELHQRKAEVFYERKRVAKEKAKLILFENNSEDQKESPVTLNNLHRISSHEQHVGEQHPDKIVNEYKEHYRDYHEQKEQASDLSWDHGKHANKSQGHLHHQHVPCGPKESLTDISEYEVKTEEITAGMTSRGMNDKKTKEDNTEREMLIPEFLGRVSSQLQKVSDLSGVTTVDEGTEEKTCVIERVIKSNPEENVVTGTQLSNDTTQNTHQGVFFGHIKDCSKHLSGGLDQKPCQKDIEDHRQIVNDQSQSKQAKGPDKAVDVSVKDEYSSMEINIMEATMDNNEWMNINGLEMNNDFPALSLKDESDYVAAGTGGMSLVDSESVLRSLDGHPSEGVATVKRQSQSVKVNFSLHYVTHSPFQLLAVTGSSKELGYWEKFVPLLRVDGGFWSGSIALPVGYQVEWKFVLVENDKICRWEECNNRYLYTGHDEAINLHKCWGYI